MSINQISLPQTLIYLSLAQQLSNLSSLDSSQYILSDFDNNSSDISPILSSLCGLNSKNNNFLCQNLMKIILNSILKMLSWILSKFVSKSNSTTNISENKSKDITKLTNDNLDSSLRKQKGTSFVIICGENCERCKTFNPIVESINGTLGNQAAFYNISGITDPYWTLKKESGTTKIDTYSYPMIIKCVDGVAKEFYTYSDIKSFYADETKMQEWFSSKI